MTLTDFLNSLLFKSKNKLLDKNILKEFTKDYSVILMEIALNSF
jgi:hypothetical protein